MAQHILLIQDDAAGAVAVRDALRGAGRALFQLEWIRGVGAAVKRLAAHRGTSAQHAIAATLVDLSPPDGIGIEELDRLVDAAPHVPVLVLCTVGEEEKAKIALRHGAQAYLAKERVNAYSLSKALIGMIERTANAPTQRDSSSRAQETLDSIGDAVISTDTECRITYLNKVAERLTGWSSADADGCALEDVFCAINADTGGLADNAMAAAIRENKTVILESNSVLLARDGLESAIEDSAAPIHDRQGRVTGAVMVFRDVSTARALSQRMSYLAQHDSLTGLPNRLLLNDRLTHALAVARRYQHRVSVLFLDIDHFKSINDAFGHAVGDRLLQLVAGRLTECLRDSDTVGRQGGDEFVMVLANLERAADGAVSAEKILDAIRGTYSIGSQELTVTASIGIATYPDDGGDATTLLQHADRAMYGVKEEGRNHFGFAGRAPAVPEKRSVPAPSATPVSRRGRADRSARRAPGG